jgi:hypothetical protein
MISCNKLFYLFAGCKDELSGGFFFYVFLYKPKEQVVASDFIFFHCDGGGRR